MIRRSFILVGLFAALCYFGAGGLIAARAAEPVPLITTGPVAERLNVVLVTDGYTAADHAAGKGVKDALAKASGLLALPPWNTNAGRLNFWLVPEVSKESGITKTVNGVRTVKDTALGTELGINGTKNLLGARDILSVRERYGAPFAQARVVFTVLANESASGGGEFGGTATITRGASSGVWSHEMGGHALANLADEYLNQMKAYVPGNDNVARSTNAVPWLHLLVKGTPIPTPATTATKDTVGVFKRGLGYVPQQTCLMNDTSKPPCAVCLEAMTRAILKP